MFVLQIIQILLLIVILILVILLYINGTNSENFCNCFGSQYDGLSVMNHPQSPICSSDTTHPLYKEGGCSTYDPSQISKDYEEGKLYPKGV